MSTEKDCSPKQTEERWVIGKVVTTVTTTRVYDVYSDDWDFAYWDEEPNDEDVTHVLMERGPRDVTEDVDWEWELTTSRTENVETSRCFCADIGESCDICTTPKNVENPMSLPVLEGDPPDEYRPPDNVECRTCNGQRTWTDSDDGDWFACPDCWTPENVEEPT